MIDKPGKGAFYATDLDEILTAAGITNLIVTGVTTEVCVHTTVREANDRGYEVLVLSDCVGSYFPEFQRVGLDMIAAQGGIFGWVRRLSRPPAAVGSTRNHRGLSLEEQLNMSIKIPTLRTKSPDQAEAFKVPWWTRGDTNAFFGLAFNILVNVLTLTALLIFVVKVPAGDGAGHGAAGAGHRADRRQRLLHLPGQAAGTTRAAHGRHRHAVRPERSAHVHRRVRDHAADLSRPAAIRSRPGRPGWPGRS